MSRPNEKGISNIEYIYLLYYDEMLERWEDMKEEFINTPLDSCWLVRNDDKYYGTTTVHNIPISYHIISYVCYYNKIPTDVVMHLCNQRNCMNPAHIMEGTQSDNLQYARFFHDHYIKELKKED